MSDEVVWRAGILYTMEPWVGLISYHNPARVIQKKIIQESCIKARLLFHVKGLQMEIVTAVKKYDSFLNTEYNLVLGRKCKSKTIRIIFDKYSWFHVGGIHYLTDIDINLNRRSIDGFYDDITEGRITEDYFRESSNYEGIQGRIKLLSRLDEIVESLDNKLSCIYAFSKRDTKFYTTIDGDYLIVDLSSAEHPINLFLVFEK